MEKLDRNFADFLKSLNAHSVEYLMVGGVADPIAGGTSEVSSGTRPQDHGLRENETERLKLEGQRAEGG